MLMNPVIDFLGYMLFSSLDFFALYLLGLSLFSLSAASFKRELLYMMSISTLITYVFVIFDFYTFVPSLLITPVILTVLMKLLIVNKVTRIKKKWMYSVFVAVSSMLLYSVIQLVIAQLLIHYDFLILEDLGNSFSYKTYVAQTISSLIGIVISNYLIFKRGGFGFIFKSGKYRIYTLLSLVMLFIISFIYQVFESKQDSMLMLTLILALLCTASAIVLYLSYKQDDSEY